MTHKQDMKRVMVLCVLLMVVSVFAIPEQDIQKIQQAMPTQPVAEPAVPRTLLVFSLCSGFKHDSIPYWIKALDVMSEKTGAFKVVHSTDMSIFSEDSLKGIDAICFNNTTKLVPDASQQKVIMDFIKNGKGIVGIHAATDNFYEWPKGMEMMGGVFTGHPWTADGTWAIKLDDAEHPLMKSFQGQGFKINDEIYRTSPPLYSRKDRRVLMSLDMSDETTKNAKDVRPDDMDTGISWIKPVGKGRLFYCSLGHNNHLTWNRPVLEHYLAGIQYALGDFKVSDSPLSESSQSLPQDSQWAVHDKKRPRPTIVKPGMTDNAPPSDAIVLFDGTDLSKWTSLKDGGEAKWKVQEGYMEVVSKTGDIQTREPFGSCQLHIEWQTPIVIKGQGQGRGNSGVFLMGKYEVQVLDSYNNETYADGQAGALYGQNPPLVNVCKKPGQWQSYDIIFHAPEFEGESVTKPATITVLQNGILVQDHWEIKGTTFHKTPAHYQPHAKKLPLRLQDHGNPMRFRNVWIRPLEN
jgi:type 1 glutamine amidotransferase